MDVESCLQISQASVQRVLQEYTTISQVVVPEKYRLWDSNKPGMVINPIALTAIDISQFFFLDAIGNVFQMKMHYPADLTVIDDTLKSPLGLAYVASGFLLVSEPKTHTLSAFNVLGNVHIPENLTVAQLKAELKQHKRLSPTLKTGKKSVLVKAVATMYQELAITPVKPISNMKYPKYHIELGTNRFCTCVMCPDTTSDNTVLASDVTSGDIVLSAVICDGFEISINELARIKCEATDIDSVACVENDLFYVAGGKPGGLYKVGRIENQTTIILENKESINVLSTACSDCYIAVGNAVDGSVTVFDKSSMRPVVKCGDSRVAVDGIKTSFVQPSALQFNVKGTIIVCDAAAGQVKVVSLSVDGLVEYVQVLFLLNHTFGVHMKGKPKPSIDIEIGVENMERIVKTLSELVTNASKYQTKCKQMQGPDGTPASKTVRSVEMISEGIAEIRRFLNVHGTEYPFDTSSVLTLVCEHLFAMLRSKTVMPDVLQVSRMFASVLHEHLKKTSINCGFSYHTHRRSYYSAPEGHTVVPPSEQARITGPAQVHISAEDRRTMRNWRVEHGQKVRQNTVRNASTKDRPGTLPISMYCNYKVPSPSPVDFVTLAASDDTVAIATSQEDQEVSFDRESNETESSSDEVSTISCVPCVPHTRSRSGRTIQFNRAYEDFV